MNKTRLEQSYSNYFKALKEFKKELKAARRLPLEDFSYLLRDANALNMVENELDKRQET